MAVAEVIVVGAGPVGMLAAGMLRRSGVAVTLLEKRAEASAGSRAIGVHAPVLAALEASGTTERLLERAVRVRSGEARADGRRLGAVRFDTLSVRFPFVATLPQAATEEVFAAEAPPVRRAVEVTAVRATGDRVRVFTREDGVLESPIVLVTAGAGARPLVFREEAVTTHEYPDRYLMADLPAAGEATAVVDLGRLGVLESFPLPGGLRRFVVWDLAPHDTSGPGRTTRMRESLRRHGEHEAAASLLAASAFRVRRTVAPRLARGGIVVLGDTAHEVSPIGGQGMNLGLLDAATLAPIVADWVRSGARPDSALRRWEGDRVASARTAARLAAVNTALGRPLGRVLHAARTAALTAALHSPASKALAHAYAMGLDRAAA